MYLKNFDMDVFDTLTHTGGENWTILHGDTLQLIRFSRRVSMP